MAADVAQWEYSNIKFYASVFSNILMIMHYMLVVVKNGKGLCPVKTFTRHDRFHWTQAAPMKNVVSLNLLLSYDNMVFFFFIYFIIFKELWVKSIKISPLM